MLFNEARQYRKLYFCQGVFTNMVYRCVACGVPMAELKNYLLVNGNILPYCQAIGCQKRMKDTKQQFFDQGIEALKVEEFVGNKQL
jgi:hypothetical protein